MTSGGQPGGEEGGTCGFGAPDKNGDFSSNDNSLFQRTSDGKGVAFRISNDNEDWEGIKANGSYWSKQEIKAAKPFIDIPVSVFADSGAGFFDHNGQTLGQIQVINSSTTTAYNFTSLVAYKDLDLAFLNSTDFNSPAAIASGTLAFDAVAAGGITAVTFAGQGDSVPPLLTLPLGAVAPDTYVLVTGTAEAIEADNQFGPPFSFAMAFQTAPEPSALALCSAAALNLVGVSCWRRWRASRKRRDGASLSGRTTA